MGSNCPNYIDRIGRKVNFSKPWTKKKISLAKNLSFIVSVLDYLLTGISNEEHFLACNYVYSFRICENHYSLDKRENTMAKFTVPTNNFIPFSKKSFWEIFFSPHLRGLLPLIFLKWNYPLCIFFFLLDIPSSALICKLYFFSTFAKYLWPVCEAEIIFKNL